MRPGGGVKSLRALPWGTAAPSRVKIREISRPGVKGPAAKPAKKKKPACFPEKTAGFPIKIAKRTGSDLWGSNLVTDIQSKKTQSQRQGDNDAAFPAPLSGDWAVHVGP